MTDAPSGPYGPFEIPEDFAPEEHGWSLWQGMDNYATSYARNRDPGTGYQESLVLMRHPETGAHGAFYGPVEDMGEVTLRQLYDAIGVHPEWSPDQEKEGS